MGMFLHRSCPWRSLRVRAHWVQSRKTQGNHTRKGSGSYLHSFQAIAPPSYTEGMSIVRDAASIAKGMSITLKEVFQPTEVEKYPDGIGPMRGAKFQERFRG